VGINNVRFKPKEVDIMARTGSPNSLAEPPIARLNPQAIEALSVWAAPGNPQTITLRTTWKDAGAWGLVLADVARHASKAYAHEGRDANAVLARIREAFDAEWAHPTGNLNHITNENGMA
jgi:hypothetical protein